MPKTTRRTMEAHVALPPAIDPADRRAAIDENLVHTDWFIPEGWRVADYRDAADDHHNHDGRHTVLLEDVRFDYSKGDPSWT